MPEYTSGRPFMIRILFENMLVDAGVIKLIHDGNVEGSQIYTRKYKIYLRGKDTGCTMKFIYNKRDDWSDMSISYYNLLELKFRQALEGIHNDRIQIYEAEGSGGVRAGDEENRCSQRGQKHQRLPGSVQEGEG